MVAQELLADWDLGQVSLTLKSQLLSICHVRSPGLKRKDKIKTSTLKRSSFTENRREL